jgi:NADH:ubiquinone oxidoreductase subunit D
MPYVISDIADEAYREISNPSTTSISALAFYFRSNIGSLNNLIAANYSLDTTTLEITPALGDNEKEIYKKIFHIDYIGKIIRENTGASAYSAVIEVSSDRGVVRKVTPTMVNQNLLQFRKQLSDELKDLVDSYNVNSIMPTVVNGDDYLTDTNNYELNSSLPKGRYGR